jgi:hypothetical protein|tara:strand:- start:4466 stop:4576 length:111 start_codon:yes stop_codon:yes gene_type:complete
MASSLVAAFHISGGGGKTSLRNGKKETTDAKSVEKI